MPEPNPCGMIMVGSVSVSFKWSCDLVLVLLIIGGNLEDISRSWRRMAHLLTALFLFFGKILLLRCVIFLLMLMLLFLLRVVGMLSIILRYQAK